MQRKPENRQLDIQIINALARHRVLRRRTLGVMFPGFPRHIVYNRLCYLYDKGMIEKVRGSELYRGEHRWHEWDDALMHYLSPTAPRVARNDLETYEIHMIGEPPSLDDLEYYYYASTLLQKLQLKMEDGRRFRCQHLVLDCDIDLVHNGWLLIYERNHTIPERQILLENCESLIKIQGVKGIVVLCKTHQKCGTLFKFWNQNNGPQSVHFCARKDYSAVYSIITETDTIADRCPVPLKPPYENV
jgi:hypothetical protein